ncbi:MAG: ATP-binding protein [Anaerolineaceae bacterium]|nr:ATP-binding protein [Anaerolineaceae bacterium]
MASINRDKQFYLGKQYDLQSKKLLDTPILYDPADLTTHAVVTGMTGSGKTGLCIGLLEEAALQGIPAIMIDPKGDLTNLLLHFPDLLPSDFEPWMDPDEARREDKTVKIMAEEKAALWKKGLGDWGVGKEDLQKLTDAADFAVYTPGSKSGIPVNILSSFACPDLDWETNAEMLRDKISATVTGVLGLVGLNDIDPLRSREHILLANILESAWSAGKSLDLTELIMQVQNPPFDKLGAFPLENLYPEKERFDLAMLLNNFLASPSFQTWMDGQSLDIASILYTPDGKPRHSVFYIAHLDDAERMFFVTLLFAAIESWMRMQRGSSGLRALIYFDEILGYLPPVANPPSRPIMLRMLKQARAFGVGLVLATQNPVDLDYKALSNIGTWMIGRLQTERDKQRLLDGLEGVAGTGSAKEYDKMISGLQKRVFLLHNVHEKKPELFQTRWVMNYLAGPLTRTQIPALNKLMGVSKVIGRKTAAGSAKTSTEIKAAKPSSTVASSRFSQSRPGIPGGIQEQFLGIKLDPADAGYGAEIKRSDLKVVYQPAVYLQTETTYYAKKFNLTMHKKHAAMIHELPSGSPRWEELSVEPLDEQDFLTSAESNGLFATLPDGFSNAKSIQGLDNALIDWIYRTGAATLTVNETLNVAMDPEEGKADFRKRCADAARDARDQEAQKLERALDKKLQTLETRIKRQEMEVDQQEAELGQRRMEEIGTAGSVLLKMLSSKKASLSSSMTKRRMTSKAKAELEQETQELEDMQAQLEDLMAEKEDVLKELNDKWANIVDDSTEISVTPYKKDIYMAVFSVLWMPYYQLVDDDRAKLAPAFRVA